MAKASVSFDRDIELADAYIYIGLTFRESKPNFQSVVTHPDLDLAVIKRLRRESLARNRWPAVPRGDVAICGARRRRGCAVGHTLGSDGTVRRGGARLTSA